MKVGASIAGHPLHPMLIVIPAGGILITMVLDAVHLATEGPLGWAARLWLKRRGLAFSTAIHTRFPEYVSGRWRWIRRSC